MRGPAPMRRSLLPHDMAVRVPLEDGSFGPPRWVRHVRFARTQSAVADEHRAADAGAEKAWVDAVRSVGAFEVPAGSRVEVCGASYFVAAVRRCEGSGGRVHHWELTVR